MNAIKSMASRAGLCGLGLLLGLIGTARAGEATVPGVATTPYPTIHNLAVEWLIEGDDNLNAVCTVHFRAAGESAWREGLPLRRVPAGASQYTDPIFTWRNKLSGSLFDLEEDTEYELRLTLSDPDGGAEERLLTARTRAVPRAAADAKVRRVTPATFRDSAATAHPGDILLLGPGNYGAGSLTVNGDAARPIVIRGGSTDPARRASFSSFSLRGRYRVILECLTVDGSIELREAVECAVRRCTVNAEYGIIAKSPPGARNCYIADNTVSSTFEWKSENMGASGKFEGEGIELTGSGNVICFNRVSGYRDCISTMEDQEGLQQYCIDIHNNDLSRGLDDAIEADFCMGNCRIMRNRITNCFMGLSSQPGLGGPTYFIRNVMYNIIDCPFKLARYSQGDVLLHNTVVKVGDGYRIVHNPTRLYSRNNLAIGGTGGLMVGIDGEYGSGDGRAMEFYQADSTADLDYEGLGAHGTPFVAKLGATKTYSIEELRSLTPIRHAVLVGMEVFAYALEFPNPALTERAPADLRLASGGAATDAGLRLPGINDSYRGAAPDLGACEAGEPLPQYGPRPWGAPGDPRLEGRCDLDGDGRENVLDALVLLVRGAANPADQALDWDGDGRWSAADVVALLRELGWRGGN